jgi:1-aminocyclopropane-1-carboxylate deaminase
MPESPLVDLSSYFEPFSKRGIQLFIKREDLLHPHISGNKYRKLFYNLKEAKELGYDTLLTFGGAFSNHIVATAYAAKKHGFNSIGIIRGEELAFEELNPSLQFATSCGMNLHYVSRSDYREKNSSEFIEGLKNRFGSFYLVPEGGTNELAVKGCEEILNKSDESFTHIALAVGTAGTISGLIRSSKEHQRVLGFPALKGDFLKKNIGTFTSKSNWELITDYHFGGYAKINRELVLFINDFYRKSGVPLDPIYTAKMAFGVFDLAQKDYFKSSDKVLMIHTGGLQAIEGMNNYLRTKKLPQLIQ